MKKLLSTSIAWLEVLHRHLNSLRQLIRQLPIPKKLHLVTGILVATILVNLVSLWFGMNTLSAIRAYVAGEGFWAKAQKDAVYSLIKYSVSRNETDFSDFLKFIQVPIGDQQARLELEKANPDLEIVRQGFIRGGNSPEDIARAVKLYQRFRTATYMARAIKLWEQGDTLIAELQRLGGVVHQLVARANQPGASPETLTQLALTITQVDTVNRQLSSLERAFSTGLGEASRQITSILLVVVVGLTIIAGVVALVIVLTINRAITDVDHTKNEFVSLASHQLRTPLATVSWYSEKLIKDLALLNEQTRREYIQEIQNANHHMIELVEDLLSASRIELGAITVSPQPVKIISVAEKTIEELLPEITEKQLTLERNYKQESLTVRTEPRTVEIIFENLLSNAVRYTPPGGVIRLAITATREEGVVIEVADTGYGIPNSQQSKIFQKLFRADNVRSRGVEGNGLGLYITRAQVEHVGGRIWFLSKINQGSTFWVLLPSLAKTGEKNRRSFHRLIAKVKNYAKPQP